MKKKKIILLITTILFLSLTVSFNNAEQDRRIRRIIDPTLQDMHVLKDDFRSRDKQQRYASSEILVKFKSSLSENEVAILIETYQSRTIKKIQKLNVYQIQIPEHYSVEEMVYAFDRNPDVEYAEPNYIARITATPNDLLFQEQYALHNTGQSIGVPGSPSGTDRADIKAPEGWEETKGTDSTLIAILDTGIDLVHPDLQSKVLSGGRDFVNNDFDASDDHWHGTHVAGIAAAETNNNEGIAGVAWNCKLLPVKVLDQDGDGYYSWIAEGIRWAADNGADVINMSFGGPSEGGILREALHYAKAAGVVLVASAGNEDDSVYYPAAYDEYCIAVAATDYNDERPWWSNPGPEVDVAAPGVRILSCSPTWYWGPGSFPYGYAEGTSQAAPHVTGLAALIKDLKPWLRVDEIMDIIRYTAEDVNSGTSPGFDEFIGYGRINMDRALVPI
ncbi:MAG: S8 family serine peptidase, partial [Candidatus Aminicenantes bacterium]|nr:S8 family serine peptidase [Candidatus Aminicenantes bacterium]